MNLDLNVNVNINMNLNMILKLKLKLNENLLSGRTLHGVCPENWSCWKGLGFNLCVAPPRDRVVPNFGVTEFADFMKVFWSIPEKTEKTE